MANEEAAAAPQEPVEPKKPKPEEIKVYVVDGFMMMFTALAMILLAFFIMLNTMAVPNDKRKRAAIGSLLGAFGMLPQGVGVDDTGAYVASIDYISLRDEVILFAAFDAFLDDEEWPQTDVLVYVDDEGRRRIRLSDRFLFGAGNQRVHPRVYPILDRLAVVLKKLNRPIEVEGHTDTGKGKSTNWHLSARRSAAVLRYLETAGKMGADVLTAVGYGHTRTIFGGRDWRNRRVEIVVH